MTYIALLRGINVGGTGKLAMADLIRLCTGLGHTKVRTYIQSGNVIFESPQTEPAVQAALQQALHTHMGKPVDVFLRSTDQLKRVLAANPFRTQEPNKVHVIFLHEPPAFAANTAITGEQLAPGLRELYVYYPLGQGQSKLKLPTGKASAAARNLNTVSKLIDLAS